MVHKQQVLTILRLAEELAIAANRVVINGIVLVIAMMEDDPNLATTAIREIGFEPEDLAKRLSVFLIEKGEYPISHSIRYGDDVNSAIVLAENRSRNQQLHSLFDEGHLLQALVSIHFGEVFVALSGLKITEEKLRQAIRKTRLVLVI